MSVKAKRPSHSVQPTQSNQPNQLNQPNRSNQPTQPNQPTPRAGSAHKIPLLLQALDGYSNAAAFLGDDSPLLSSGTFVQNYLTRDLQKLTAMYRSNWICKRIIDIPVEDATRAWYSLDSSLTQEELDEIKKLEAKHNVKQELANAMRWARLYGGSIALIALRGEEDKLAEPLDPDSHPAEAYNGKQFRIRYPVQSGRPDPVQR